MLRKIDIPSPQSLQRLDRHLLLHHPDIWASRIHIVLFYGGALLLVMMLHAFLRPISIENIPHPDNQFLLAAIPSLLAFGPFAYHISLFNVEKGFGFRPRGFGLRQQLSLAASIFLLACIPFLYASVVNHRVADLVEEKKLLEDIHSLDLGDVFFPDYHFVFEDNITNKGKYNFYTHKYHLYAPGRSHRYGTYQSGNSFKETLIGIQHYPKFQVTTIDHFIQAFNQYQQHKIQTAPADILRLFNQNQVPVRNIKAHKIKLKENLNLLFMAKEKAFDFQRKSLLHQFSLFLMGLWLMLLLFQKMRMKDFSLGTLAGTAVGFALFGGVALLADWWNMMPATLFFPLFIALFTLFFFQIKSAKNSKLSSRWKSITLMWTCCMIPFLPLISVAMDGYVRMKTFYMLMYVGFALFLLCWNVFLNQKFTWLLSQPTEN